MKKRIFLGIKADGYLQTEVGKWQKKYQGRLRIRWIKGKNLHVTLLPPWYEDEDKLCKQVIKKLKDLDLKIAPFSIQFKKVEFGPDAKRPRLIWATGQKPHKIEYLEKLLSLTLNKKPQRKSNFIHLTIARFKETDFKKLPIHKLEEKIGWKMRVDSFSIFESKLTRNGAEYRVLSKIKF